MQKKWSSLTCVLACFLGSSSVYAADAGYKINPGDLLEIMVWKEANLDRATQVLPDGSISFPLVGVLQVKGETTDLVRSQIESALNSSIPGANVTVTVVSANGDVIDVVGQVNKPGEMIVSHPVSVMQALSMAGGLTPYASERGIKVLHRGADGEETATRFPYNRVAAGKDLDKDVLLRPGDVVVVPEAGLF